jgi:hypothetical protein
VVGLFWAFDTGELGEVALRRVIESEITPINSTSTH